MLAIDYTERLIDGFTVASGTLETDFMDILISSKRLTGKIQEAQEKILKFQEQFLNMLSQWIGAFAVGVCDSGPSKVKQQQMKNMKKIDEKKKQVQKKLILHQLRNILKTKSRKIKSDLNTSYKSLNPNQISKEQERMSKLNSSIRMVQKDLGIQQESENLQRSYLTQRTVESIDKDQTLGNQSILSIQNVVRHHQFILDSEIKKQHAGGGVVTEVTKVHFQVIKQELEKEQDHQYSNKILSSKPPPKSSKSTVLSTSSKKPIKSSATQKQSVRIQQIKDNLSKYKEDLLEEPSIVPTAIKSSKQVIFSQTKTKGTFDDAIKQSYEALIRDDLKK